MDYIWRRSLFQSTEISDHFIIFSVLSYPWFTRVQHLQRHALVSNNCIHIQALFIYCCPDCPSCLANVIQTGQATGPIWAWGPSWPTGDDDGVSGTWNVLFMIWRSWVRALVRSNFGCILLLSKSYLNQTHKKEIHPQSYFHQNKVRMFTRTLCARKHTHTL